MRVDDRLCRHDLTDEEWQRLLPMMPADASYPNGRALQKAVLESPGHLLRDTARYKGEDPGGECGAPIYTMEWAIKLVQYPVGQPDMFG